MLFRSPDPLFSKLLKGIEITNLTQQTIDEQLEQRSYKYWLTIQVEGLQYVHSAYMQLEGWYTSVYLVDGVHKEEEEAIHTVEMSFNEAKGNIYGEYWSFGPHQSQEIKNRMVLTFVNGKSQVIELKDMSAHIKSLKTGGEIVITQKIVITGDDKNDTGFIPSIVDWEDIEIEKPI